MHARHRNCVLPVLLIDFNKESPIHSWTATLNWYRKGREEWTDSLTPIAHYWPGRQNWVIIDLGRNLSYDVAGFFTIAGVPQQLHPPRSGRPLVPQRAKLLMSQYSQKLSLSLLQNIPLDHFLFVSQTRTTFFCAKERAHLHSADGKKDGGNTFRACSKSTPVSLM